MMVNERMIIARIAMGIGNLVGGMRYGQSIRKTCDKDIQGRN